MPQRPDTNAQLFLLPPSLDELVPRDHPVRYVVGFVDALSDEELEDLGISVASKDTGAPRYAPRLLLRVWLCGFVLGIRSARGLERATQERFDLYWAAQGQHPDHNTLWRFYQRHRARMRALLRSTITTAVSLGLVELAVQAVDGTKVLATATPDRQLSAEQLARLAQETEAAIADLEAQNRGDDPSPPTLPQQLQDARELQRRIAAARAATPAEPGPVISRSDPEARWMKTRQGIRLAYNAQLVVTPTDPQVGNGPGRIVLAAEVTTQANDQGLLTPLAQAAQVPGHPIPITLADAGYSSRASLRTAVAAGVPVVAPIQRQAQRQAPYAAEQFVPVPETDAYRCPAGATLRQRKQTTSAGALVTHYRAEGAVCQGCPAFGVCTTSPNGRTLKITAQDVSLRQHAEWMDTDEARALSKQRPGMIEPVFGTLKERYGARRTLLRGRANVEAEWVMTAIAINLRTLARAAGTGAQVAAA